MRLIDGDKLTENAFKNPISYNAFCNLVKRQPTVDAVPVVRCRNCRFSQRINDWVYYCYVFNVDKVLNQYCDMGERKDGCDEKAD